VSGLYLAVDNVETATSLLVALGYELLVAVEGIRTGALVDDVLVAVDTLARLGVL